MSLKTKPTTKEDMAALRRELLDDAGISNKELVEEWGCSPGMVSGVITGMWRSREKEEMLARRLGVEHDEIFLPAAYVRKRSMLPSIEEVRKADRRAKDQKRRENSKKQEA